MIKHLYRPIDAAILVYFRIIFGLLIGLEFMIRAFNWDWKSIDWTTTLNLGITIYSAIAITFNYHYRIFSKVIFISCILHLLPEQAERINHTYFYLIICFCIMLIPLDKNKIAQPAWMHYLLLTPFIFIFVLDITDPLLTIAMAGMLIGPSWPRKIPILREFMPWGLEVVK